MDCREILEKLHAYHDSELSPAESWEVEDHLCVCDACRKALEEIRRVDAKLLALPGIKASASFDAQLARRMKKGTGIYRLLKSRAVQLAMAASVMVIVGILAMSWTRRTEIVTPEEELPNLSLLDDGGFLGVDAYDAGIGDGLEVQLALSDSQDREN